MKDITKKNERFNLELGFYGEKYRYQDIIVPDYSHFVLTEDFDLFVKYKRQRGSNKESYFSDVNLEFLTRHS